MVHRHQFLVRLAYPRGFASAARPFEATRRQRLSTMDIFASPLADGWEWFGHPRDTTHAEGFHQQQLLVSLGG
jgi:hypothetical protein